MITIYWHDKASLVSSADLRPLDVIEAMPGSKMTNRDPWAKEPLEIFGYVKGLAVVNMAGGIKEGDQVIDPLKAGYVGMHKSHRDFCGNEPLCLRVGEIKGAERFYTNPETFHSTARVLHDKDVDTLFHDLSEYLSRRSKKEYVFQTPEGRLYYLKEVLLGLREVV